MKAVILPLVVMTGLSTLPNISTDVTRSHWSWWRSLPPATTSAAVGPHVKARKFLHLAGQWVNVPKEVVEGLILQSQGAVLSNLDGLIISNGSVATPRSYKQEMFEVINFFFLAGCNRSLGDRQSRLKRRDTRSPKTCV